VLNEINQKIQVFEETLQKLASQIATGILSERIPPAKLLETTEKDVDELLDSAEQIKQTLLMLKPEKAPSIESYSQKVTQTLRTFRDILQQKSADPLANSRLALDQLRNALTDGSDFLVLTREVLSKPSPLIDTILKMRLTCESKGQVLTIKVPEETKPFFEQFYKQIQAMNSSLKVMEKALTDLKRCLNTLQYQALKTGSSEKEKKESQSNVLEKSRKQLSLQNFRGKGG